MKYIFKNQSVSKDAAGRILMIHKSKHPISKNQVYSLIGDWIEDFLENYDCSKVQVYRVHSDDVLTQCSGESYERVYFESAEYSNSEIWYPFSRIKPQLKRRLKLVLDKG